MQCRSRIKSYRRRCLKMGRNTGLAHYILLKPGSGKQARK